LLAEQQSQNRDPENDKTTDEFLQFIADPAADEEKKLKIKKKDKKHAAILAATLNHQLPLPDDDGQNSVVPLPSPHNPPENV